MIYLIDTNIASEPAKPQPDGACIEWLKAHREEIAVSPVTIAELRSGIERRADGKEKARLEREFGFLMEDYREQVVDFGWQEDAEWGRYSAELEADLGSKWWEQVDFADSQIAAIARQHSLKVATRNGKDFPFVDTVNPFAS